MEYAQRRKEQAKKTETTILNTALALMKERGFEAVTVRDICQAAGITTGAFYHHFASKEELFSKGFAPLDEYMKQELAGHEADCPVDRLRRILQAYAQFMEGGGELTAQYYQRRMSDPSMASLDPSRYVRQAMLDCLKQARDTGSMIPQADPVWVADFFMRHFRGTVIDWLLHHRGYSLTEKMLVDYDMLALLLQSV